MKHLETFIIYIALREDGVRKLGSCRHVGNRIKGLQSTYGMKYEVEKTWAPEIHNVLALELLAHKLVNPKYRISGEHYKVSKKYLMGIYNEALAQWEREWNWERTKHGLERAKARGVVGGQPSHISDKEIKDALKKAGTLSGAAKLLKCAKITIKRRQEMWSKGKKLVHAVKK